MKWFHTPEKPFFSEEERALIRSAIAEAEMQTSGEIRVFVENNCRFVDAIDRAAELFFHLQMDKTANRNAVLVYVALKDRQLAIYADVAIHQKGGPEYWKAAVKELLSFFNKKNYALGMKEIVLRIGSLLKVHFPYDGASDKNELPDEIVFGK